MYVQYNVTLRRFRETIVAVEKQCYVFLCVCARVCVCAWAFACACVRVALSRMQRACAML